MSSDHFLPLRIPMHSSFFTVIVVMAFRGAGALSFARGSVLRSRPVHTTARQSHSQVFFPYGWSWELEVCLRRRHFTPTTSMKTDVSNFLMNIFRCGPFCLSFGSGCGVCLASLQQAIKAPRSITTTRMAAFDSPETRVYSLADQVRFLEI